MNIMVIHWHIYIERMVIEFHEYTIIHTFFCLIFGPYLHDNSYKESFSHQLLLFPLLKLIGMNKNAAFPE